MDVSPILNPLNKEQREVVTAELGHSLILAGAGSGKTRVLTHRIAWLCVANGFSPYSIVTVTFTNKAAREMRTRLEALLDISTQGMWLGTFHGLCHRILRIHWREAGLRQSFQVLDAGDQKRLIKRVTKSLNLDPAHWTVSQSQWFINTRKEEGVRPNAVQAEDFLSQQLLRIYTAYEENCRRAGLVDFTELLLRTLELLRDDDSLRRRYHEKFRYILVDEFQDTNSLQYAWLRLLAGSEIPVFAVGDDDQSIYGWRGACVENIRSFSKDFPNTKMYRLERNYRSTSTILSAANALIEKNQGRLGKNLWTDKDDGEPILLFAALNEKEEARFAKDTVATWINQGRAGNETAILYRSNAQSRVVETELNVAKINYRVYGGLRFFERAVIKDALAYLKMIVNPQDDQSYERIINMPPRGIGDRTLDKIQIVAREENINLWQAGRMLIEKQALPSRASSALAAFYELMDKIKLCRELVLHETTDRVIKLSGLIEYHKQRRNMEGESNVENLKELISATEEFDLKQIIEEDMTPLDAFLAHVALDVGEQDTLSNESPVQLMTLHSAKGLEFPLVIILGMEEGLFPHAASLEKPEQLEEERRLCYVGITRAQERLVMAYAMSRRRYGGETRNSLSRFINEIPQELLEEVRPRLHISQPVTRKRDGFSGKGGIDIGSNVRHGKFGRGVVLKHEGSGDSSRVQVQFESVGVKWLVLSYANLKLL